MSEKLKILEGKLDEINVRIKEADAAWDFSKSFDEFSDYMKPLWDEYNDVNRDLKLIKPYELKDLPTYGKLMTMEMFIANVRGGGFIDYDGHGSYATSTQRSNITINPSDILSGKYRKDFTHVMWFNR